MPTLFPQDTLPSRAMRFVERRTMYSLYRAYDGMLVRVAHRTFRVQLDYDEMQEMWTDLHRMGRYSARTAFITFLRGVLADPDIVDDIVFCDSCWDIDFLDDCFSVEGDGTVCANCFEDYVECVSCDEYCADTTEILGGSDVCSSCLDRRCSYCDECEGYFDVYDSDESHEHDEECGCESPAQSFTVRNDGNEPLRNDTRVTVGLPAGTVDAEGIARIERYLVREGMWDAAALIPELGDKWQTRDGNFTKRLSRLVYNRLQQKIAPGILSQIGCIARDHSTSVDFEIETTRDLNLPAEEFYHSGSCWWQSYTYSRCALKSNGGFGLRTFDEDGDVSGRAWVIPLKAADSDHSAGLSPTFETTSPDAFIVFNGYGKLEGYNAARIASHMAGWTYRKISFTVSGMFVNNDSGYLIAPEEIATHYTDGDLHMTLSQHADLHFTETRELSNVA